MATHTPAAVEPAPNMIARIEAMEIDALRALWSDQFGPPPSLRSVDLMRLALGWRVQAKEAGGIDKATRRKLKLKKEIRGTGLDLAAGTTLTREWQGQTYTIMIEEDGFRWEGELYPSLSAVARAITGTRWNGPRFFGFRSRP